MGDRDGFSFSYSFLESDLKCSPEILEIFIKIEINKFSNENCEIYRKKFENLRKFEKKGKFWKNQANYQTFRKNLKNIRKNLKLKNAENLKKTREILIFKLRNFLENSRTSHSTLTFSKKRIKNTCLFLLSFFNLFIL